MADDPMQQLTEWGERVREALGVDGPVDERTVEVVLAIAADSAHGVLRPAAPVTTYLAGLAVAQHPELDLDEVRRRIAALLSG